MAAALRLGNKSLLTSLGSARTAWRDVLGAAHVITEGERLELANRATFSTTQRSTTILEPASCEEIVACLEIANRFRISLYPVSAGRNWGYGSSVPVEEGSVLLSLARLDKILDFHEELAYVTIEPGVTFLQLANFLKERGSGLLAPEIGGSARCSLIGNVLERGVGKHFYEQIAARSCCYEIVLANGKILRTGPSDRGNSITSNLRLCGTGPDLQGLFNQSNLGVVTKMTIWLQRAPKWRQMGIFYMPDVAALSSAIESLRPHLQRNCGTLQMDAINDYKYAAQNYSFPYDKFDGAGCLPRGWVKDAMKGLPGAQWIGRALLWGEDEEELRVRRRQLEGILAPCQLDLEYYPPEPSQTYLLSEDGLMDAYWRKRGGFRSDPHPDRDLCGVLWVTPVLPMVGSDAASAIQEIENTMISSGFEPCISLRLSNGRSIQAIVGILYDREEPGTDTKAAECHSKLHAALSRLGLYVHRLGIEDMASQLRYDEVKRDTLRALKELLDPHGILAPGRYIS